MEEKLRVQAARLRAEARERGDKSFISISNCRQCGGNLRYTSSGGCVACSTQRSKGRQEYLREWFQRNRDRKVKAYRENNAVKLKELRKEWEKRTNYSALWRSANSDKVVEYRRKGMERLKADQERYQKRKSTQSATQRAYYARHSEEIRERTRKYYEEHREQAADRNRAWVAANREKVREINKRYAKANSDKVLANVRKRQLLKRRAIPNWLDEGSLKKIQKVYELAKKKCESLLKH